MLHFDANITFLYRELPLVERFAAARADGFGAVEILSPEGVEIGRLASAAAAAGVNVALCNAPIGDFLDGGPGLSAVPGREAEFRRALEQARQMAVALGCQTVHLGPSRVPAGADRAHCLDVLAGNLAFAARALAGDGITATIEPMNTKDYPDICLRTVADAHAVLTAADESNTALQFDVYHMAQMEDDLHESIATSIRSIGHFQFADVPGRHEPGSGTLDFAALFRLIEDLGYRGFVGAEYLPSAATSASLGWLGRFRA
jgi:hydroxypyruvate isomerase